MTDNKTDAASSNDLGVMEGKGFYNRHSRPQRGAVAFGLPLLERAVEAIPLPGPGGEFQVADYGVAGGNNSMEPVRTVIDGLRRRASDDLGDEHGSSGAEGLMDMANAALQGMVEDGTLTSGEYERMVIPTYNRTLKEFEAPFAAGSAAGVLNLESSSEVTLPDPFWPEYEQSGDAGAFAADYEEFFRAAYEPSLFGALGADRTPQEHEQISDTFYEALRVKVAADPVTAACNWRVALLLIAKNPATTA